MVTRQKTILSSTTIARKCFVWLSLHPMWHNRVALQKSIQTVSLLQVEPTINFIFLCVLAKSVIWQTTDWGTLGYNSFEWKLITRGHRQLFCKISIYKCLYWGENTYLLQGQQNLVQLGVQYLWGVTTFLRLCRTIQQILLCNLKKEDVPIPRFTLTLL